MVVLLAPARQLLADIVEGEEPLGIQALIPETSIETLDEAILNRFAGPNKIQLNPMAIGSRTHHATGKLAPIVHGGGPRRASPRWATTGSNAYTTVSPVSD